MDFRSVYSELQAYGPPEGEGLSYEERRHKAGSE